MLSLRSILPFVHRHLPSISPKIALVAHQHDADLVSPLRPHVLDPPRDVQEGSSVRDVIHHYSHRAISDIGRDQRAEPLLTSRVPQLQADGSLLEVHGGGYEIYTYGTLQEEEEQRQSRKMMGWLVMTTKLMRDDNRTDEIVCDDQQEDVEAGEGT